MFSTIIGLAGLLRPVTPIFRSLSKSKTANKKDKMFVINKQSSFSITGYIRPSLISSLTVKKNVK